MHRFSYFYTSVLEVLVTVTRSVDPVVEDDPPPLSKATNIKIKTAAPTTHTHGSAYQVLEVVVVVFVTLEDVSSCAIATTLNKVNITIAMADLNENLIADEFIFFVLLVNK